jgi:XTP/dITP diphosphohydrolase
VRPAAARARLLIATGSPGKLAEFGRLLSPLDVDLVAPDDIGLEIEVVEDGLTFLANAQKKARAYAAASGLAALADDSGLVVEALGGEPGVQSAVWGGGDLDAAARNALLLNRLEGVTDRSARFVCVLCLGLPGRPVRDVWMGECQGRIGREPRGQNGFGYDPVFVMPDGRTMAELPDEEKDVSSHRGRAVAEMLGSGTLPSVE